MEILSNKQLSQGIYALDLTGDFDYGKVQPGQFVNVLIAEGKCHPLRRPLSIAACDAAVCRLTLIYRVVGAGTKWLSEQRAGTALDVLGPLGNGFPLHLASGRLLAVGGGVGIPPLYQLVKELAARGLPTDIILGFKSAEEAFWLREFSKFGPIRVCTEDGSLGEKGSVITALKPEQDWSALYACGPKSMLRALKLHFADQGLPGYVSLEERMACGIGACQGCVCETTDGGTKRVCRDGPVFPWEEVVL